MAYIIFSPLRWRHNGRDRDSNHHPHGCLLNRLFRRRSMKTSKLCVTGLCVGNSPGIGEFPAQMASNAENVSIWWRHHTVRRDHIEAHMQIITSSLTKVRLRLWWKNNVYLYSNPTYFIIWILSKHRRNAALTFWPRWEDISWVILHKQRTHAKISF